MSKHLHHELGETLVNNTQTGAGDKMMAEAAQIWSRSHAPEAGAHNQAGGHDQAGAHADKSFSHQMQQLDKRLHAAGGPLHGKDELHLVGYDKSGHLMLAHVPHGKSQADEMYVIDPKTGKVVGECAWKNGKPAGPITKAQEHETNSPVETGDMRKYFFRPDAGQRNRFDQIDRDGNGSLTKAEFENFLKSVPNEKRTSLNVILNNWDKIAKTADHDYWVPGSERDGIYRQDLDQWLKDQQQAQKKLQLPGLQISGPDTPVEDNTGRRRTA